MTLTAVSIYAYHERSVSFLAGWWALRLLYDSPFAAAARLYRASLDAVLPGVADAADIATHLFAHAACLLVCTALAAHEGAAHCRRLARV